MENYYKAQVRGWKVVEVVVISTEQDARMDIATAAAEYLQAKHGAFRVGETKRTIRRMTEGMDAIANCQSRGETWGWAKVK